MEIEIEKTVTKKTTANINIGDCFQRDGLFYFRIITDNFAIKVVASEFQNNISIETCSVQHIFRGEAIKITNELFMQKFNEVSEIFRTLVGQQAVSVEVHEPVKKETIIY